MFAAFGTESGQFHIDMTAGSARNVRGDVRTHGRCLVGKRTTTLQAKFRFVDIFYVTAATSFAHLPWTSRCRGVPAIAFTAAPHLAVVAFSG